MSSEVENEGEAKRLQTVGLHGLDQLRGELLAGLPVGRLRLLCPEGHSNCVSVTNEETGEELEGVLSIELHAVRDESLRVILVRYANETDHDGVSRFLVECWLAKVGGETS